MCGDAKELTNAVKALDARFEAVERQVEGNTQAIDEINDNLKTVADGMDVLRDLGAIQRVGRLLERLFNAKVVLSLLLLSVIIGMVVHGDMAGAKVKLLALIKLWVG